MQKICSENRDHYMAQACENKVCEQRILGRYFAIQVAALDNPATRYKIDVHIMGIKKDP